MSETPDPPARGRGLPGAAGRVAGAVRRTDWVGKGRQAMRTVRDEFEAGKRGDDRPVTPIAPAGREQIARLVALLRAAPSPDSTADAPTGSSTDVDADDADEADEVAGLLRRVDWGRVTAATGDRAGDVRDAMTNLARQVDWDKVRPVAARVSSALIAAAASGQLGPIGGPVGTTVARAIVDQAGLAERVAGRLADAPPPDFRPVIDARLAED